MQVHFASISKIPFPEVGCPLGSLLLIRDGAKQHQVGIGFPHRVDPLGGVQPNAAVTCHKKLCHALLPQNHDLLEQLGFQFPAEAVLLVKAARKPHGA